LMFALELDRRSREGGWGIVSNAAHPGLTLTNLQTSGPSHGKTSPTLLERFYRVTRVVAPFAWQSIDMGILPALYAATSPAAKGGDYYGPRGVLEITGATARAAIPARASNEADLTRLWDMSEQLTGVVYPKPA
jgi:hypothetical protein